jgi:hypothetical protein
MRCRCYTLGRPAARAALTQTRAVDRRHEMLEETLARADEVRRSMSDLRGYL